MNKYLAQKKLSELFSKFQYHEKVLDEIEELIIRKGLTAPFLNMFQNRIEMIEALGKNIIQLDSFEKLKDVPDLYSMKFKRKDMNLRILFSYDEISQTILLHCFYEKQDSGKDRYERHIPVAMQRKKEMEER